MNFLVQLFKFMGQSTIRVTFLFLYFQELCLNWWFYDVIYKNAKAPLPWFFWVGFFVGMLLDTFVTILEFWGAVNYFFKTEENKKPIAPTLLPRISVDPASSTDDDDGQFGTAKWRLLLSRNRLIQADETLLSTRIWSVP